MRLLLSALLPLLFVLPTAADDAKPNTLTPKEIADGWLLLFDGTTTFGWKTEGSVKAAGGALTLGGDQAAKAFTTAVFGSFELRFQYRYQGDNEKAVISWQGPAYRRIQNLVPTAEKPDMWKEAALWVELDPANGTVRTRFAHGGVVVTTMSNNRGAPAVGFELAPKGTLTVRNLKLRPLDLGSIFNGKDLTGWKEHPGRKSKFTVTPEGWLNIKDGPGDLQTEEQWGDFVLQLECLSHGKHLNSGVFFRCRPGEYQQGYEAQIRNQFTAEPTQTYVIEEHDPQTGELKEKRKVQSPAVDYGTGAIYRRQPARREASKDGDWFTMTVVAHGRHLATWVNGIQVTDWTDHRKLSDNARNGCRLEKGPISLQGHDPTTNLSFRNFRIAELPAAQQ